MPPALAAVMVAFRPLFSKPAFERALVLTAGALLAVRTRTVAAVLRVTGRDDARFSAYHRILSRARWSCRRASGVLLGLLVERFAPAGPLVVGIDDTIERRWGAKITARGIYRDPVRSSRGFFVKVSGLRWLSLSLLAEVPWAARVWALPFLTVLCPSARYYEHTRRVPKKLTDQARQALLQLARWLPERRVVVVADSGFAAIELLCAVRERVTVVTRLRLDAALYDAAPLRQPGQVGRPRKKGARQPTLAARATGARTRWTPLKVSQWYGRSDRTVEIATGTAVWYHAGKPALPLRWVLVRVSGSGEAPKAFLCTDTEAEPLAIVRWYVRRWQVEVTFAEVRRHLGVETQRQWSDLAITRTTPCLLGLFSVVALAADALHAEQKLSARQDAWYRKQVPTFSDALAAVRLALWRSAIFEMSGSEPQRTKKTGAVFERMSAALAYAS